MKQNDWTQNLRSRLGDRKAPVPDDLWDKIESRINMADGLAEQKTQGGKPDEEAAASRMRFMRFAAWAMSAAAAAALLVAVGYHANHDTIERLAASGTTSGGNSGTTSGGNSDRLASGGGTLLAADNHTGWTSPVAAYSRMAAADGKQAIASAYAAADTTATMPVESAAAADATSPDTPHSDGERRHNATPSAKSLPQYSTARYADYGHSTHTETTQSHWTVGVHTAGTFSDSRTSDFPMQHHVKSALAEPSGNGGGANCGDMTYSSLMSSNIVLQSAYKEVTHHAQPVSVGLSLEYALDDRLSLVSGLVYTRASSDFIKSAGGDDIVEKQRLHYIGVPLGVKCRMWSNSTVHAYATAGAQADFNVSATLTSGSVKADIAKDRVQFSANAAAGLQVDVVPHVGVYAEPGVKYYFDNGSQMQTAFKDNPWSFNLQIGLRVGF